MNFRLDSIKQMIDIQRRNTSSDAFSRAIQISPPHAKLAAVAAIFLLIAAAFTYVCSCVRDWYLERREANMKLSKGNTSAEDNKMNAKVAIPFEVAAGSQLKSERDDTVERPKDAVVTNTTIDIHPPESTSESASLIEKSGDPMETSNDLQLASQENKRVEKSLSATVEYFPNDVLAPTSPKEDQKFVNLPALTGERKSNEQVKESLNVSVDHFPYDVPAPASAKKAEVLEEKDDQKFAKAPTPSVELKINEHLGEMAKPVVAIQKPATPHQPLIIPDTPALDVNELFKTLASATQDVPSLPYDGLNFRFSDIPCPSATRTQVPGATDTSYLHANNVQLAGLKFIATQYPLPQQFSLFWRAAQQASLVLDLTNSADMQQGLESYYPPLKRGKVSDDIIVKCSSKQILQKGQFPLFYYIVAKNDDVDLSLETTSVPRIPRLHFQGWNDQQGIKEDDIDHLLVAMDNYRTDPTLPILIHCRAGVGRTGTLIVARALSHLIQEGQVNSTNLKNELSRLILEGRKQRGDGFVQKPVQLLAIWKWAWRAIHRHQNAQQQLVDSASI